MAVCLFGFCVLELDFGLGYSWLFLSSVFLFFFLLVFFYNMLHKPKLLVLHLQFATYTGSLELFFCLVGDGQVQFHAAYYLP